MLSVGIIDYGVGNLRSLAGAVSACGASPIVTADVQVLKGCDCLMLPGVGAFGDGMKELASRGLVEPVTELVVGKKTPVLGICLGAQLMGTTGYEFGQFRGLGWIPGEVKRIEVSSSKIRLPHVGWNQLLDMTSTPLLRGVPSDALFYFVHSFCIHPTTTEVIQAYAEYGSRFAAVIQHKHICGMQFHPEKSQRHGLSLIKNFLDCVVMNQFESVC